MCRTRAKLYALAGSIALLHAVMARAADDHAVILLYHHVSDDAPASTSLSPAVFESHLRYLEENDYEVLPLAEVVAAIRNRQRLPARAVSITFDDAYRSILTEAMPRLERRSWPFTLFVSTEAIDQGYSGFMTWDELRQLESAGAAIANHSRTHGHLVRHRPGETFSAWRIRIASDIEHGQERLNAELENPLHLFAWPYGEFDTELEGIARDNGYVAFGQQSGPAGPGSGLQHLPRFPMAAGFADIESFAEKLHTRPLPVSVVSPVGRILEVPAAPPTIRLRIPDGPYRLEELRCFVPGQAPAHIERNGNEFQIAAHSKFHPGRGKFNCTAPSSEIGGVYYWYSHLLLQRKDDGSWYDE